MIVYNEIVALTSGASLLGFAWFLKQLIRKEPIESEGWAGFFGVTGLILLVTSFTTSTADKAKADGVNLNLWTGLGLIVIGAALIAWAVTRPIVVDERELEADKAAAEREGGPAAH